MAVSILLLIQKVIVKNFFAGLFAFDRKGVDGAVNGVAGTTLVAGKTVRKVQTGQLQFYGPGAYWIRYPASPTMPNHRAREVVFQPQPPKQSVFDRRSVPRYHGHGNSHGHDNRTGRMEQGKSSHGPRNQIGRVRQILTAAFRKAGLRVKRPVSSVDDSADIVFEKDGKKYLVQCKGFLGGTK